MAGSNEEVRARLPELPEHQVHVWVMGADENDKRRAALRYYTADQMRAYAIAAIAALAPALSAGSNEELRARLQLILDADYCPLTEDEQATVEEAIAALAPAQEPAGGGDVVRCTRCPHDGWADQCLRCNPAPTPTPQGNFGHAPGCASASADHRYSPVMSCCLGATAAGAAPRGKTTDNAE